jgi:hypothetical protein
MLESVRWGEEVKEGSERVVKRTIKTSSCGRYFTCQRKEKGGSAGMVCVRVGTIGAKCAEPSGIWEHAP